jgi:hypothetical protein
MGLSTQVRAIHCKTLWRSQITRTYRRWLVNDEYGARSRVLLKVNPAHPRMNWDETWTPAAKTASVPATFRTGHLTKSIFLISNFHRVLNIVCILLGISPASDLTPGKYPKEYIQEIYFVFRYTNLLVCNISWYRYVLRLLMTSVIITREFSKIKVTVNTTQSPRKATICRLRQTHVFNTRSSSSSVFVKQPRKSA